MTDPWLERWQIGRTGWHEEEGNRNLRRYWTARGRRVLVPLCGKTPDLLWLESMGNAVVGVELSPIAAEAFFTDNALAYRREEREQTWFVAAERRIAIACGDYFEFSGDIGGAPLDACYDRGSLVALSPAQRRDYVRHTRALLTPEAHYLLIAVEYDQSQADGPPFSLEPADVEGFFPGLRQVASVDDLANCPPKFRDAGISWFNEVVWAGRLTPQRR